MTPELVPKTSTQSSLIQEPKADSFVKTRDHIRESLALVDKAGKGLPGARPLSEVWDDVNKFTDTNELIMLNIQQNQVFIQDANNRHWARRRDNDEKVTELFKEGKYDECKVAARLYQDEEVSDQKHIQDLQKTQLRLAQEYRQCAMQKRWLIHVAQVKQFELIVQASIHRNVHDQNLRNQIAEEIEEGVRNLFPINAGSNY